MQDNNNTYSFYGPEDITRYLSGSMNAQEMHDMEKAALKDPLLADAIDGFRNAEPTVTTQHLQDIRGAILGFEQKMALVTPIRKPAIPVWRWVAAACSLGLVAGSVWWFTQKQTNQLVTVPIANNAPALAMTDSSGTGHARETSTTIAAPTSAPPLSQTPVTQRKTPPTIVAKPVTEAADIATAPNLQETKQLAPAIVAETPAFEKKEAVAGTALRGISAIQQDRAKEKSTSEFATLSSGVMQVSFVQGKVTDESGSPIPSATVTAFGNRKLLTQRDGTFSLPFRDSSIDVSINSVGYNNVVAILKPGKPNHITLTPVTSDLNEVVVIGYGTPKRKKGVVADYQKFLAKNTENQKEFIYPDDGWSEFYKELESDLGVDRSKATRKTLQIKFTVDENGDPVDFTIVDSPDDIMTRKAIEFIKKTKWKNFKLDKNAMVKIQVN